MAKTIAGTLISNAARGALDGAIATAPMTVVMTVGNQLTGGGRLRSLPPTRVGKKLSSLLGLPSRHGVATRMGLGMLAHFAVGAVSGMLYRSARQALPADVPIAGPVDYVAGAAFGTAVWASGYVGVLPALGLVERPRRAPPGQTATMVVAHWVYGAALTALARRRARLGSFDGTEGQ